MNCDRGIEYNTDNFPYSRVLFDLSEQGNNKYIHPVEAYKIFIKNCAKLGLRPCPDYFSTSVTSGGVARLAGVSYESVVVRNAAISHRTMEVLAKTGTIDPKRALLPTDISSRYLLRDWQQKDYITFWHLVISGVRPANFRKLRLALDRAYAECGVDLDLLNNSEAAASDRAPQHYKLTSAVIQAIRAAGGRNSLPVGRVINLNDTDRSLGCRAERDLAGRLGVPTCAVQAVVGATADDAWVDQLSDIADDMRAIIKAGGHLLLLRPSEAFNIVQVPEVFGESDTHLRATDLHDLGRIHKAFRSRERCMSAAAGKLLSRGNIGKHLNPLSSASLAMSIRSSEGVNGAMIENGQVDFVACDQISVVETIKLLAKSARQRGNCPPIIVSTKPGDERTEQALNTAGLCPIGGGLWSLV